MFKHQISGKKLIVAAMLSVALLLPFGSDTFAAGKDITKKFTDKSFRNYIQKEVKSKRITTENVKGIKTIKSTISISITPIKFKNLNGIEYLTNLEELKIYGDDIFTIDVDLSKNKALKKIELSDAGIISLKLPSSNVLEELVCSGNQIDSINLSRYTNLKVLSIGRNNLKTLNLSNNKKLESLSCGNNKFTSKNDIQGHDDIKEKALIFNTGF